MIRASNPDNLLTVAAPLAVTAAADKGGRPRVRIIGYSGGLMAVAGWGPVGVVLAGIDAGRTIPILADHDSRLAGVVGSGTAAVVDGELVVEGTLSATAPAARAILDLAADEVPLQASIGLAPSKHRRIREGESVELNGQSVTAPRGGFTLIEAGVLREVSVVAIGADENTEVNIAARAAAHTEVPKMTEEEIRAQERERVKTIEAACKGDWGGRQSRIDGLKAQAIAGELSLEALQGQCLEELRASRPMPPSVGGDTGPDAGRVLEASVCLSAGMPEAMVAEGFDERVMNAAVSSGHRGAGIHAVLAAVLRSAGQSDIAGRRVDSSTIRAAFEAGVMLQASGFSTMSLPGLLGNVANKALLAAHKAVNPTWPAFAAIASVANFKKHTRYRLTGNGEFTQVPPDGELKHVGLQESDYSNQVDTYGAIITLTRKDIINDDLGAFMALPRLLGRMSAIKLERSVFAGLLDNSDSFFASGNSNLLSGADSALDIDALTAAEAAFLDQTDENGDPIMLTPATMLVPTALKVTAQQLISSTQIIDGSSTAAQPNGNPHAGRFKLAASPWLNSQSLSGGSATAWYLFADPRDVAAIEVAFLGGRQAPTIESGDTSFDTLGVQWRAYHDFGVAKQDPRAVVKSAGA